MLKYILMLLLAISVNAKDEPKGRLIPLPYEEQQILDILLYSAVNLKGDLGVRCGQLAKRIDPYKTEGPEHCRRPANSSSFMEMVIERADGLRANEFKKNRKLGALITAYCLIVQNQFDELRGTKNREVKALVKAYDKRLRLMKNKGFRPDWDWLMKKDWTARRLLYGSEYQKEEPLGTGRTGKIKVEVDPSLFRIVGKAGKAVPFSPSTAKKITDERNLTRTFGQRVGYGRTVFARMAIHNRGEALLVGAKVRVFMIGEYIASNESKHFVLKGISEKPIVDVVGGHTHVVESDEVAFQASISIKTKRTVDYSNTYQRVTEKHAGTLTGVIYSSYLIVIHDANGKLLTTEIGNRNLKRCIKPILAGMQVGTKFNRRGKVLN